MEDYEALPENDEVRGPVGGVAPWILALLALLALAAALLGRVDSVPACVGDFCWFVG